MMLLGIFELALVLAIVAAFVLALVRGGTK